MVCPYTFNTEEADRGKSPVWNQSGLHRKALSQTTLHIQSFLLAYYMITKCCDYIYNKNFNLKITQNWQVLKIYIL